MDAATLKELLAMDALLIAYVAGALIAGILVWMFVRSRQTQRVAPAIPTPAPWVEAEQPPAAAPPMRFIESVELSAGGGVSIVLLISINLIGAFALFSPNKTYVESTVFAQLANIFDRTNGLLMLLIINVILVAGFLVGRRRTFTLQK